MTHYCICRTFSIGGSRRAQGEQHYMQLCLQSLIHNRFYTAEINGLYFLTAIFQEFKYHEIKGPWRAIRLHCWLNSELCALRLLGTGARTNKYNEQCVEQKAIPPPNKRGARKVQDKSDILFQKARKWWRTNGACQKDWQTNLNRLLLAKFGITGTPKVATISNYNIV